MEVWKDIKGYEGLCQVSDTGKIKSAERKVCCGGVFRVVGGNEIIIWV